MGDAFWEEGVLNDLEVRRTSTLHHSACLCMRRTSIIIRSSFFRRHGYFRQ